METVDELRKRLKDEREATRARNTDIGTRQDSISISDPSGDIERYTPNVINQTGHSIQSVSGQSDRTGSTHRTIDNTQGKLDNLTRSLAQVNNGVRRSNRRSGENNSESGPDGTNISTSDGSSKRRTVGNLETVDPVPERLFNTETETTTEKPENQGTPSKGKRGRKPKPRNIIPLPLQLTEERGPNERERKSFFKTGKVLSKAEAENLAEPLITAIADEMKLLDTAIWKLTGDELKQPIWSDMTEKELETITNIALRLGQRSPVMATAVRTSIDGGDYINAGIIIGPRFQNTVSLIRETRKKTNENKSRRERLRTI